MPPPIQIYRGVVSHKRWQPVPVRHGFAYEIFMVLLDVDRLDAAFTGLWPLVGMNCASVGCFREADHMKLSRKPGQPLGEAVRDIIEKTVG